MKKILIWYLDWAREGKNYSEIVTLPEGKDLKEFLTEWQQDHLEQDITLIEAYTITEQHEIYGRHTEISEVRTVEPMNTE